MVNFFSPSTETEENIQVVLTRSYWKKKKETGKRTLWFSSPSCSTSFPYFSWQVLTAQLNALVLDAELPDSGAWDLQDSSLVFTPESQTVSNEPISSFVFCAGWKCHQLNRCITSKCTALTALHQLIHAAAITSASLKASPLPGLMEKLRFRLRSPEYPGSSLMMPRLVFHVDQFTSSTLGRQQQTQDVF